MARSREACSTVKPSESRQHDVTGRDAAGTPQHDGPDQHAGGDDEDREGMEDAQPLERAQALALRRTSRARSARQPLLLALLCPEGADQPHIADDVREIAGHHRRPAGEAGVQVMPARRPPGDHHAENRHDDEEHGGDLPIDHAEHDDAADHRGTRRDGRPSQRVLDASRRAFAAVVMRPARAPGN